MHHCFRHQSDKPNSPELTYQCFWLRVSVVRFTNDSWNFPFTSSSQSCCTHHKVWVVGQVVSPWESPLDLVSGHLSDSVYSGLGEAFWTQESSFSASWYVLFALAPLSTALLPGEDLLALSQRLQSWLPTISRLGFLSFLNWWALIFLVACPPTHDPEIDLVLQCNAWRLLEEQRVIKGAQSKDANLSCKYKSMWYCLIWEGKVDMQQRRKVA